MNLKIQSILILVVGSIFWSSCKHEVLSPTYSYCDSDSVYYKNSIAPLLGASCGSSDINCHHGSSNQNEGVDLSSWYSIMHSGEEDLIQPGNPYNSKIIEEIDEGNMPPGTSTYSIGNDERELLIKWIEQGAKNNACIESCDTSNLSFSEDIAPIISLNCSSCHSGASPDGNLLLTDYSSIFEASVNGNLLDAINWQGSVLAMPYQGNKLSDCNISMIQVWVNNGAPEN